MSKGNMLLGYSRGKVGSLVFSRLKGQQITKAYNAKPANPKSYSQQAQRAKLGNLVNFYRSALALLNHSFINRDGKQSSYNAFVGANLKNSRVYLTKSIVNDLGCIVGPYRISAGSLPPIEVSGDGDGAVTNIALGSLAISGTTTVGDLSAAMLDNNANILVGDQLSYVSFVQGTNANTGAPKVTTGLYELTIDRNSTILLSDVMPAQAIAVRNGFLGHGTHVADGGFAWILSRKNSEGLDCSSQSIILNNTNVYDTYITAGARDTAVMSYDGNEEPFLVPSENVAVQFSPNVANPSFGQFKLGGTVMSGMNITTQKTISANAAFEITGGDLANVVVDVKINGTSQTENITTQQATIISGTLGNTGTVTVNSIEVTFDGTSVFTWAYRAPTGGGGYDSGN